MEKRKDAKHSLVPVEMENLAGSLLLASMLK